jgi:hypothetical protein
MPPSEAPPLESLPAHQVQRLLRALREHHALLDSAYHDALRMGLSGRRPGYILDFQLLFRHMFPAADHPEWEQELVYLFSRPQTRLIIGPGTIAEIDRFLTARGLQIDSDGQLTSSDASARTTGDAANVGGARTQAAIQRLAELLARPNVEPYARVVDSVAVDQSAYETAYAALERRRRRASIEANTADALNWAAVVHLRHSLKDLDLPFYPYLLTATRPLLDERRWSAGIDAPISREPSEVIYTEVLFDCFGDNAHEALNHTVEMSLEASNLEKDLKFSPSLLRPEEYEAVPEWETVVSEGRVGERLRNQLHGLAQFVSDPVIRRTQQIYDNLRITAESSLQQSAEVALPLQSPVSTKLFDLIVGINAALSAKRTGSEGLAALWSTVLEVHRSDRDGFVLFEVTDRGSSYHYLAVERHETEQSPPLYILRWPSSLDAERVLTAFSDAFARHSVGTVDMSVGLQGRILSPLEADLPIALSDILQLIAEEQAVTEQQQVTEHAVAGPEPGGVATIIEVEEMIREREPGPEIAWLRMNAEPFDLYADVVSRPPRDPLIGLFQNEVNVEHVVDLFLRTSARYSFRAWLTEGIRFIIQSD